MENISGEYRCLDFSPHNKMVAKESSFLCKEFNDNKISIEDKVSILRDMMSEYYDRVGRWG